MTCRNNAEEGVKHDYLPYEIRPEFIGTYNMLSIIYKLV